MPTSPTIRDLQSQKAKLFDQCKAILDLSKIENRDLTEAEAANFDQWQKDMSALGHRIAREEKIAAQSAEFDLSKSGGPTISVKDLREDDPTRGFANFAEFAQAVYSGSSPGSQLDNRLLIGAAAPSTFGNEGTGADGGFAVPPEFSRQIFKLAFTEDSFVPFTENNTISGNSMVFPKDETTPWGTDGVRAYWQAEATAATATKPKLGAEVLRMHKLMALVPLTEELVEDTNALQSYLPQKVATSIRWKTNEAILFGTGAGQPLGIFNGSAAIAVAKDGSQTATTVTIGNITRMIARLPEGSFQNAVWLVNNDVLPQLFSMTLGNYPIYLPIGAGQGGVIESPYIGMLLGRPILVTQHAKTLGQQGDINLIDFKYYRTITKAGGIQTDSSLHLYFDAAVVAFRSIFRIDGKPILSTYITPANGTAYLSPFVQVAVRS